MFLVLACAAVEDHIARVFRAFGIPVSFDDVAVSGRLGVELALNDHEFLVSLGAPQLQISVSVAFLSPGCAGNELVLCVTFCFDIRNLDFPAAWVCQANNEISFGDCRRRCQGIPYYGRGPSPTLGASREG